MTLSLCDADFAFSAGYHLLNRFAKQGRPHLWFDTARRKTRPDLQDFVPYLWPAAAVPFATMTITYGLQQYQAGKRAFNATTATSNGIRHRGSQARAWRGICALGDGSRSRDRALRLCAVRRCRRLPFSERLCRNGGTVSGQALMAFADTAMVIANLAANRGYRPMTTVDQTTHFMRAVSASDVLADARVVRLGRTMSFGRVTLSSASDNKPVAMVSSAFAML